MQVGLVLIFSTIFFKSAPNQKVFLCCLREKGHSPAPEPHPQQWHRRQRQAGGPQHSLAGRVHLGCVEEVDAALVGDGHQLLSHLAETET